jgi:hypothetical protein
VGDVVVAAVRCLLTLALRGVEAEEGRGAFDAELSSFFLGLVAAATTVLLLADDSRLRLIIAELLFSSLLDPRPLEVDRAGLNSSVRFVALRAEIGVDPTAIGAPEDSAAVMADCSTAL